MNGFEIFVGFVWTIATAAVLVVSIGWAVGIVKDDYAKSGFMEHKGQYYSVKPAIIRAEPIQ